MIKIYEIVKEKRDRILKPLSSILYSLKIEPNHISIIGALFVFLGSYFIYTGRNVLAISSIIVSLILDILDGAVARMGKKKGFGFVVDLLIDHFIDFCILVSFYAVGLAGFLPIIIFMFAKVIRTSMYVFFKLTKKKDWLIIPLSPFLIIGGRYFFIFFLLFPNKLLVDYLLFFAGIILIIEALIYSFEVKKK